MILGLMKKRMKRTNMLRKRGSCQSLIQNDIYSAHMFRFTFMCA